MTKPLNIAIAGIAGRMGRQLVSTSLAKAHTVTGGTERTGSPHLGADIGTLAGLAPLQLTPGTSPAEAAAQADAWIDFTVPAATLAALEALKDTPVQSIIIGTTGFSAEEEKALAAHAARYAIVKAGNFSLGIALLTRLTALAAEKLGADWDLEIMETHHKHKVDAPSGTALMLGQAAADGRGGQLKDMREGPYDGPNAKRTPGKIGFSVRRSGSVIGEHDVTLTSDNEQLTLAHKALDRRVFADGAIKAAEWAIAQSPGLYSIHDLLEL